MAVLVSTERLGWPGDESGLMERWGLLQKRASYPRCPDEPTATCHLQLSDTQDALCGYAWEGLVAVPGAVTMADVPEWTRCDECVAALATGGAVAPTTINECAATEQADDEQGPNVRGSKAKRLKALLGRDRRLARIPKAAERHISLGQSQIVVAAAYESSPFLNLHVSSWAAISLEIHGQFVAAMSASEPVAAIRTDPGTYRLIVKDMVSGRTLCSTTVDVIERSATYVAIAPAKPLAKAQIVTATLSTTDLDELRRSLVWRRRVLPASLTRRSPCE
jgi:hypothetical protein